GRSWMPSSPGWTAGPRTSCRAVLISPRPGELDLQLRAEHVLPPRLLVVRQQGGDLVAGLLPQGGQLVESRGAGAALEDLPGGLHLLRLEIADLCLLLIGQLQVGSGLSVGGQRQRALLLEADLVEPLLLLRVQDGVDRFGLL